MAPSLGTTTAPGEFLAPFVPSPEALVDRMLDVAGVGPGDTVYDLGAGDGRIVVAAAQRFGARAVGVELDDARFALASARIRDLGLEPRARIIHGDLRAIDLRPATVVTLYQLPSVNEMLRPALERQLRPGARVVALDFPVSGWEAARVLTGRLADGSQHAIYLYSVSQAIKESASVASGPRSVPAKYGLRFRGATGGSVKSGEGEGATAADKSDQGGGAAAADKSDQGGGGAAAADESGKSGTGATAADKSGQGGSAAAADESGKEDNATADKESATMATDKRSYVAGSFALEIQGVTAGFVKSVEGGDASADVVTEKLGTDFIARKHLAGVKYQDIALSFGTGMSSTVYDWIAKTMGHTYQRLDGAIVTADYDYKEVSRLNFYHGLISEIGFPALDASSKSAAYLTLKIAPEYTRFTKGGGTTLKVSQQKNQKSWLPSNFRLQIDGLDCTKVNQVDALTIKQRIQSSEVGELRDYQKEPASLEIPNLAITLTDDQSADAFRQWHEDFVIKGNNGQNSEKSGTLQYLGPNLKDVLFTLTFQQLGIFKLTLEKLDAGNEKVRRLRAEMYCEDIGFQYGASVGSNKGTDPGAGTGTGTGTGTGAATGAPTSTRSYSGTPVLSPVYVQPFTSDVASKFQPAQSKELVADAPLRLARPLKFRS